MDGRSPEPTRPARPSLSHQQRRALIAAGAVVAILVPLLLASRPAGPPATSPVANASASAPAGPTASPGATGAPEAWGPLTLEPFAAVADLTPSTADPAGVAPVASFALHSLTDATATDLAQRIRVVPDVKLRVTTGADAKTATLTPLAALKPGETYRFALRSAVGTLEGSWAFRVRGPVRVMSTLPRDAATGVPVTSGIEVTFDQEDVADMAPYFSIEPAVKGTFERHGRAQVFVPSALAPRTLYTVTLKAGLPRTGSDLKLEQAVTFRFETMGEVPAGVRWVVGRDVIETSPASAPVIGIVANRSDAGETPAPIPATAKVKVFRYRNESAAASALQAFLRGPRFMEFSGPTLQTDGLPLDVAFTAKLEVLPDQYAEESALRVLRFPAKLDVGSYAVEIEGDVPAYVFLQVTRVSAWVAVLRDRTVLWVNDVVSHAPISGATAALPGRDPFGTSRSDGVVDARTPSALLPAAASPDPAPAPPILVVRSGTSSLLVAFDVASTESLYRGEWWQDWDSTDTTYWSLLETDRWQYRTTDTVATWGYLKPRDGGTTPREVEIRVVPQASWTGISAPAIASARVPVDAVGVYSTKLAFDHAPIGSYEIDTVVDGRIVATRWIEVTVIRKPEYSLSITTDHHAIISGSSVHVTATATFFDGSPVPGRELTFASDNGDEPFGTTDGNGQATMTWTPRPGEESQPTGDGADYGLQVAPSGAESSAIDNSTSVFVFPASEHLAASGSVSGGRLHVTGTLRTIDLAAVERAIADGSWTWEPAGPGIVGRRISVLVTDLVPVKTRVGTRYDYIEKVTVPIYEYTIDRKQLSSTTVVTTAGGQLVLDLAVPAADHQYEVAFTTEDSKHRPVIRTITVGAPELGERPWDAVLFEDPASTPDVEHRFAIGDPIDWTMSSNGKALPSAAPNRYLYIVAQRGLIAVSTSTSPRFRRTFSASDAPGIFVIGVRFTGSTYAPKAASWANFDVSQRKLSVTVTADHDAYRPGDDITLTVKVLDEHGHPVVADVVLQAVDEKLFAVGAASTPDPLDEMYRKVVSGIVRLTSTHQLPTGSGSEGEGGDGGGGDSRDDFRDMLAFVRLETDASGVATTVIKASDDLTSWHVSASALTGTLRAGVGELLVPVGLPVFASLTVADDYLVSDTPSIQLRAFGTDLHAGDPVTFTVQSASLGLPATTVAGKAFESAWLTLPALQLGRQSLDVAVSVPGRVDKAGAPLADRVTATFGVVASRVTIDRVGYGTVGGEAPAVPSGAAATYTFTDAGRGRYLATLLDLVDVTSQRLDRQVAAGMARSMLEDVFGRTSATLPPETFDASRYEINGPIRPEWGDTLDDWQHVGIALLPYAGADPWLATRIVFNDPAFERADDLRWMLQLIRDDAALPRDLRVAAVAALASLGEPVSADIATLRTLPDLTQMESIHLGLAAAAAGDEATAREIERALLVAHGQRLGPWVRLNGASARNDVAELTATLAVLAARVGDPLAPDMLEYVLAHPSTEASFGLEAAATVAALLDRTPAAPASFAYTVDGSRTVVDLTAGQAVTLSLTAAQAAAIRLERVSGQVGVAIAWREGAEVAARTLDPTISLTRAAAASVPANQLVTVTLQVAFKASALDAPCYGVTEEVPSGLIPLSGPVGVADVDTIVWPTDVVGQEVTFCVSRDPDHRASSATLRYVARIVSTGTFTWEPAVMRLDGVPEVVTVTGTTSLRIGE
jgi:hypothetical protein